MCRPKSEIITLALFLITSFAAAADTGTLKANVVLEGNSIKMNYGYAWLEPASSSVENEFVLTLLFSEKPQTEPQNKSKIIPTAIEVWLNLNTPDSVRFGNSLISEAGSTSILSTADKIVLTSIDTKKVEGKVYHKSPEHTWEFDFSLPLLTVKDVELKTGPLGERLPADGGAPGQAFKAYLKALKSGDPGAIRKFTTPDFGKMFSMPDMRVRVMNLKDTFRDDVEFLSAYSNGSLATLFVKRTGSNDGSEMGIAKLIFIKDEWRVSTDIFTKFY